ncbi:orotidine-5'-phosphate decarboxylase [Leptolyngbya sp. NIES-2104]|uniref:orotidine-5'-phosphate decarboxylase n=1 Tax=Leptolyngbya sp. NIES-2104 TaxID=1552121 RepID=UPI0006EC731A|nr:orotidine-5'-phosphate decarboxylase [Leptolyngbya sp. NIES-2104]GAP94053.1 orotidine 5'-phosphate decarboxylase [Leptolyngbya sp. NIES-2104]
MNDRIIVPLDVSSEEAAIALIDRLPQVTFWKVGLELFVSSGSNILKVLKERQKRIFLDLKFHDIPNTVAGACGAAARFGVDLITIHATAGKTALEQAQNAIVSNTPEGATPSRLIAITVLTSLSARSLAFELKIPLELPEYALEMALLAKESGLSGAVCSPHEVAQLREVCGDEFVLVCPGVRPSWAAAGDQQRIMTPKQAIGAGASYLVIGRPITAADDPVAAFDRICEELAV